MFFNSESYTLPVFISVLLHGVLIVIIAFGWEATSEERKRPVPNFVPATLVQMEKAAPKAAPKPQPRTIDRAAQQREKERQEREAESRRQAQAKKEQAERERKQREQRDRQEREAEQRRREEELARQQRLEQELSNALAEEEALIQSEQDEQMAMTFSDVIYSKVYRNWSYPPSTRRGMTCKLRVQLVPTGRVVNVTVIEESGNPAFDRSAVRAVEVAQQFPELQELPSRVFEQHFREIILTFDPQDTRL